MPETVLHTKLFIPPLRPHLVPRIQLSERLDQGLQSGGKLILISVPAGYGKTTFAVDWLQRLATSQRKWAGSFTGWLTVDETDNDPVTFVAYLVAAIRRAISNDNWGDGIQILMKSANTPTLAAVSLLINEINALDSHRNADPITSATRNCRAT